ncbi:MAG TPA: hypothetical protein VKO20_05425 [Desulfosalsimonadaceae bacterium]|nr:hypothetical protein [Desulfosalsimonadaceae bacterium]
MQRAEILRKLLHLGALCIPFGIVMLPRETAMTLLIPPSVAMVAADRLRQRKQCLQGFFLKLAGGFLRPAEKEQLTGASYLLLSGIICLLFFEAAIAYTAMAFLIIGDAAAALVGMRFGRIRLASGKSLEGTAACMMSCMLFWMVFPFSGMEVALAAAVLTGILEVVPTPVNDNLSVPVICAFVLQTWQGW